MTTEPYLVRLTVQLAEGLSQLPIEFRERHIAERPDQPSLLAALDRVLTERRRT